MLPLLPRSCQKWSQSHFFLRRFLYVSGKFIVNNFYLFFTLLYYTNFFPILFWIYWLLLSFLKFDFDCSLFQFDYDCWIYLYVLIFNSLVVIVLTVALIALLLRSKLAKSRFKLLDNAGKKLYYSYILFSLEKKIYQSE